MRKNKSYKLNRNFYEFTVKDDMLNHVNTLHGGELVKHFDNAAGMTAMDFAENRVVTASIKEVNFLQKILLNEIVTINTEIFKVGRSSINVYAEAFLNFKNEQSVLKAAESLLIFIGVDDNLDSTAVPNLIFDSQADKKRSEKLKKKFGFKS